MARTKQMAQKNGSSKGGKGGKGGKSGKGGYATKGGTSGTVPMSTGYKRRRWKPGTCALRLMRKLQRSTTGQLKRGPFNRAVRYVQNKMPLTEKRFSSKALDSLREACECYVQDVVSKANLLSIEIGGRKTLYGKDVKAVEKVLQDEVTAVVVS